MKRIAVPCLSLVWAVACGGTGSAPAPAATPAPSGSAPPANAAEPAQTGVYLSDIDRTADPCTDFYQFANGSWRAENPIPASMPRWSRRWQSGELAKEQLKVILEEISARRDWTAGSVEQLIGDFYASCRRS